MIILKKIDNSKKAAYNKGKYKDPGAGLYVKILDCVYAKNGKIPNGAKELNDSIKSKDYIQGVDLLKEVYLQVGNDIKNSPYGVTPYNRSGCKLPHHLIKNDSLVLSVPLVKYAYLQLWKQGGLMKNTSSELKSMKRHLDTHLKELGIRMEWHHGQMCWFEHGTIDEIAMCIMESNFNHIFLYLMESSGINLFEENFFTEASHGKLKYDFRIGYDYNTGHQIKVVYSLDNIEITDVGDFYWKYNSDNNMNKEEYMDYVKKNISKKGNNDHRSRGQKVLAIVDIVTNKSLKEVELMSPFSLDNKEYKFTRYKSIPENILKNAQEISKSKNGISTIRVGMIDNSSSFKATSWGKNTTNLRTGEDFRFNQISKKELFKNGRGTKINDIIPEDLKIFGYDGKPWPHYNNPNKQEALNELNGRALNCENMMDRLEDCIKTGKYPKGWNKEYTIKRYNNIKHRLEIIDKDIETIKSGKYDLSIMKKYKNNDFNIKKTKHNHLHESVEFPSLNGDNTHLTSDIWKEIGEKTPEALYKWMFNNIEYDKTIQGWKLKSPEEVYKLKKGNCHDQSLFSSLLLHSLNIICGQLFFVEGEAFVTDIPYGNGHTLTWYRIDTPNEDFKYSFYWLETAWEDQLGIHGPYNDMDGLKHAVIEAYRKDNDINSHNKSFNNTISISTTSTYRIGMDLAKYVSSWRQMQQIQTSDDNIEIKDNIDNQINESMRMIDDMINSIYESEEINNKKKEKFVPIFGIVKSYSSSLLRNDGTQKSDSELASVKFDKMIHKLTRGDNYSHALVSFDISLKEMYSYEDEGFVVDNIMEKESWLSTKSIYICVMFVKKSDRDRMKAFVSELKANPEQTKYAMGNLIKAYIATPTKADKRFVCSSFTGYIMQCANPKNLHRDFSRLRPDDITVLPRAFYVANVVDRNDFISRFEEIKNKVKLIYKEYKDEIEEYNNQLPKIMLSDKMQELKTIDKILDWIVNKLA